MSASDNAAAVERLDELARVLRVECPWDREQDERSIVPFTLEEAYAEIAATIPAGRLGRPEEVGAACAFLCAEGSGYLTGQNLQLDGGAYEGLV